MNREKLQELLSYHPESGVFIWRKSSRRGFVGKLAGHVAKNGYIQIRVCGKLYYAHRLAFLYMTGSMPDVCDHKNRNTTDNRWENLRQATYSESSSNTIKKSRSGYRGVSWSSRSKKWRAKIAVNKKTIELGLFDCKHHAFCEYVLAARKHFGEFSPV